MKRSVSILVLLTAALATALSTVPALAQALPRISALYPPGARAGATLDVSIRGGGLDGAREVVVGGPGLTVKLNDAGVKPDPADQKVFTAECSACHELRGPGNISRTADQWVATVDRMIRERGAQIGPENRAKIVRYVQAAARAADGLTARITVASDAAPGKRELRIVGASGTSTAFPFEVTTQPEALEAEPNDDLAKAPPLNMPVTVSGQLQRAGDADCYSFQAKKGERLVFNCSAYRMNKASQAYFFPVLYLYDAEGKELARNTGYFSLDPLIDWTAPADGKYVIQVRDMLYRGSPATIYRLSAGRLPYKTYLFPPGGKLGTTIAATVSGENMAPARVEVPLSGKPGIRQVSTGYGSFPFAADEYPDHTEPESGAPQPVTLPVGINGRIGQEGEEDRYPFSLTREQLGSYSFEAFADRVGSPLLGRLTLRNAKGQALATNNGGAGTRDPRIDFNFTQPGEYSIGIADAAGKGSSAHVYRLSAGPASPDFLVTISPDNPNLGPGSSVYLQVRVQRRVGVTGDIEVTLPGLPSGVSASRCVLAPDQNQSFLVLTAAPDARPGTFSVMDAVATAEANGRKITRDVVPYEIYRINNNAQIAHRSNMVVTVGPEPQWTVSIQPGSMKMAPNGEPVEVTVRLNRKSGDAQIPFAIVGVPAGIQAPRSVLFRRGSSELTFTMTPTNTGIFAPRSGNQRPPVPEFLLAVVNGREGDGMMMCSSPVRVSVEPPTAAAAR